MNKKANVAVFASGGGSNAEEIFKYFQNHRDIQVSLLLTNNANANVLARAQKFHISIQLFTKDNFAESGKLLSSLSERKISHIVLAGFLWLIPEFLIRAFPDKIINIHPALLPKFGGKGMFGVNVHTAVKEAGEKCTGLTIHLVNEKYDDGRILYQTTCDINEADTPKDIAQKVLKLEHEHYPKVIEAWILNKLPAPANLESIAAI